MAPQILQNSHFSLASVIIRGHIDSSKKIDDDDSDDSSEEDKADTRNSTSFGNVYLGAPQKRCSFDDMKNAHSNDPAFEQFTSRFAKLLNELLRQDDSPVQLQNDSPVDVAAGDFLTEYCFIKAFYESRVDWRAHTDYLRCSPSFNKAERYDCVIIHNEPRNYFARLLFVFTYTLKASDDIIIPSGHDNITIPIALIQPFTEVTSLRQKDKDLGLHRLRAKPRRNAIFVSARSIYRGAYIIPEGLKEETLLVIDVVDTDMFLRLRSMYARP